MSKRMTLSFKDNTQDMNIYIKLHAVRDKSCFIKEAVEFYFNHLEKEQKPLILSKK